MTNAMADQLAGVAAEALAGTSEELQAHIGEALGLARQVLGRIVAVVKARPSGDEEEQQQQHRATAAGSELGEDAAKFAAQVASLRLRQVLVPQVPSIFAAGRHGGTNKIGAVAARPVPRCKQSRPPVAPAGGA